MRSPSARSLAVVVALSFAAPTPASAEPSAPPLVVRLPIQRATLENGLRVVMNVDRAPAAVAITLTCELGTRGMRERAPSFDGPTRNLEAGELASLVASRGGLASSRVQDDRALLSLLLPENELSLGLWLQAEHVGPFDLAPRCSPNAAVLSLSGDFDPDTAMALVHRHFDAIVNRQEKPAPPPEAPAPKPEARSIQTDPRASHTTLSFRFETPSPGSRDHDALRMAAVILGDGIGARLARLAAADGPAEGVRASVDETRGPGLFRIELRLAKEDAAAEVDERVDEALAALGKTAPSSAELTRARQRLETSFVNALSSHRERAALLGFYELAFGDARAITRAPERLAAVTAEDVRRAAATYLVPARKTVLETRPPKGPVALLPNP